MITIGFLFWLIMLIWLIVSFLINWPLNRRHVGGFILWLLLFLLGVQVFGFPVRF